VSGRNRQDSRLGSLGQGGRSVLQLSYRLRGPSDAPTFSSDIITLPRVLRYQHQHAVVVAGAPFCCVLSLHCLARSVLVGTACLPGAPRQLSFPISPRCTFSFPWSASPSSTAASSLSTTQESIQRRSISHLTPQCTRDRCGSVRLVAGHLVVLPFRRHNNLERTQSASGPPPRRAVEDTSFISWPTYFTIYILCSSGLGLVTSLPSLINYPDPPIRSYERGTSLGPKPR